jgi:hypothetical protein
MAIKIDMKEIVFSPVGGPRSIQNSVDTTGDDRTKLSNKLEEEALDEKRKKKKKKKGKKDRCYRIAKRKYDVFPSAYASGAIVKCRKGKIWKGIKEVLTEEEFAPHMMYNPKTDHKVMAKKHKDHVDLAKKGYTHVDPKEIEKALKKEGGAAGLDAIVKITGGDKKEVKIALKHMPNVGEHEDGDYILDDEEEVEIVKEGITIHISEILDEKKKKKKRKKSKRKKAGSESSKESSLRDWFGRKGAKGKKGGWVDCNTCRKDKKSGRTKCKACGREKGEKRSKYPACRPTPSACKERGRGKSWGKKTAKGKKG